MIRPRSAGAAILLVIASSGCVRPPTKTKIVTVVPLTGIDWFDRLEEGVERAGHELGIEAHQVGPTRFDATLQAGVIDELIRARVDAICVVTVDGKVLEPVLRRARSHGITVVTHGSPDQHGHNINIELIDNESFGRRHIDKLIEHMGESGQYAVLVGGLSHHLHNQWADASIAYAKERHPGLELVTERVPYNDERTVAQQKTFELLKAYPDLDGLIVYGAPGPPGAAEALKEKGLDGKVALVGTVMPKEAAPYLKDGSLSHGMLWDARDVGFAMTWIANHLLGGGAARDGLVVPGVGAVRVTGSNVIIDAALDITADNVDGLEF